MTTASRHAKRALFGTPAPEDDCFISELADRIRREKFEKWAFDCDLGAPMPSSSSTVFEYVKVDAAVVPEVYRPIVCSPRAPKQRLSTIRPVFFDIFNDSVTSTNDENCDPDSSMEDANSSIEQHLSGIKKYRTPKKVTRQRRITDFMGVRKQPGGASLVASGGIKKSSSRRSQPVLSSAGASPIRRPRASIVRF